MEKILQEKRQLTLFSLYEKVRPSLQATLFMLTSQVDRLKDAMSNVADIKEDVSASEALQKAKEMTQVDRDFLHRCTESVNRHIADAEYTHHIMMNEVGASHATLYRKLKALTGMDATSFIRSIRMRSACQILNQNPDIRITPDIVRSLNLHVQRCKMQTKKVVDIPSTAFFLNPKR